VFTTQATSSWRPDQNVTKLLRELDTRLHHTCDAGPKVTEPGNDGTIHGTGSIRGPLAVLRGQLEVWFVETWAPLWCEDALAQAKISEDHGARRREIIFAQAMVESYLVEWVRDSVPQVGLKRVAEYFPATRRHASITDRWKDVIKRLHKEGHIPAVPAFGNSRWHDFVGLVELRNGLLHARPSRPRMAGQPADRQPLPTKSDLQRLAPGWAVGVASTVIRDLHHALGTQPPPWLPPPAATDAA
jgi:hypothetical protein